MNKKLFAVILCLLTTKNCFAESILKNPTFNFLSALFLGGISYYCDYQKNWNNDKSETFKESANFMNEKSEEYLFLYNQTGNIDYFDTSNFFESLTNNDISKSNEYIEKANNFQNLSYITFGISSFFIINGFYQLIKGKEEKPLLIYMKQKDNNIFVGLKYNICHI